MKLSELKTEVSELAFGYFMAGELDEDWLINQLNAGALPARFNDYRRIVDLRLTLDEQVVDFVENLERQLRSVKTETRRVRSRDRDAVKGHVNWSETFQERNTRAPRDRTLFVTQQRTEEHDIHENLVLKKFLSILHKTVDDLEDFNQSWVYSRWRRNGKDLIAQVKRLFKRNVHLNRITTPEPPLPSDRMIQRTKTSRRGFYREAAGLLELRNDLFSGDRRALETLYDGTIIEPPRERLLELFALLHLLRVLEDSVAENRGSVERIERGRNSIAEVGNPPIYLYHNSSAKDRGLVFPSAPQLNNTDHCHDNKQTEEEWQARAARIDERRKEASTAFWGTDRAWTNRPDGILFRPADEGSDRFADELLLIEVKDSTVKNTINRGIQELLEYLAYATKDGNQPKFLFPDGPKQGAFGGRVHGLLVVQDVGDSYPKESVEGPIEIVQAADLESKLPDIVDEVFGSP